jgi:predicted RNA-binding protein YlxR (DUF448 family)
MPHTGLKQQTSSKKSGPRPKHVPQRTCVVCRDTGAKRSLTRIVRTEEGQIKVDPTGRMNGRGAYLCDKQACWERAVTTPILGKALKTTPTPESLIMIREFAAGTPLRTEDGAPTAGLKEQAL